jgi:hypothetical protein
MRRIDWNAMTPAEVFEALRAAPKVAGPWQSPPPVRSPVRLRRSHHRLDVAGDAVASECITDEWTEVIIWSDRLYGAHPEHGGNGRLRAHASRSACDARLRELGWLLVDDATEEA